MANESIEEKSTLKSFPLAILSLPLLVGCENSILFIPGEAEGPGRFSHSVIHKSVLRRLRFGLRIFLFLALIPSLVFLTYGFLLHHLSSVDSAGVV